MTHTILYVFALVCFVIAAAGAPTNRFDLVAAGLAFFMATFIF